MALTPVTLPYNLPAFKLPYPLRINKHYSEEKCNKWVHTWLTSLNLGTVVSSAKFEKIKKADFPRLAAVFLPEVDEWEYFWVCKVILFFFIVDDIIDEKTVDGALEIYLDLQSVMQWSFPEDAALLRNQDYWFEDVEDAQMATAQRKRFSEEMAKATPQSGTVYPGKLSIMGNLFRDLWADALNKKGLESLRLSAHFQSEFLIGTKMEIDHRLNKRILDTKTVMKIRSLSAGVRATLGMTDVTYSMVSPLSWFYSPMAERMIQTTNNFVAWHNDLFSFKKEVLECEDTLNVVLALSKDRNLSYEEAAKLMMQMLEDCIAEFEAAAAELESFTPPHLHQNFLNYKDVCKSVMTGTYDWHLTTDRHRFD